jgi:8-oxo-dGTP diphosphatase
VSDEYPKPALSADVVVLAFDGKRLHVLLIERKKDPFAGRWALPGGFVESNENVEQAAIRELREETGLSLGRVEQLRTYSEPGRDPRGWVVSVAHLALVRWSEREVAAGDDAARAEWVPLSKAKELAFDHDDILQLAIERITFRAATQPFGAELLPEKLTLSELQKLHEVILSERFDKRNFRKRALSWPALLPLDEKESGVRHRAARYYRFDLRRLRRYSRELLSEE